MNYLNQDGSKEELDATTGATDAQSQPSVPDPAKPKAPLNPRDIVFGPPMPPTMVGGKKMFEKGLIHLTTTGIKDPMALEESIRKNLFPWQDASNKKDDFSPRVAVTAIQQLRKQAEQSMSPPYANNPMAPDSGGQTGPQPGADGEEAGPVQPQYKDYTAEKLKIVGGMNRSEPDPLTWRGVSGQNKAMLIGAIIGDLIKNKGRNVGKITAGWMEGQKNLLDQQNEKKKTKDAMALEIARIQLDELGKKQEWENNQAGKTYQENLDAYNTRKGKGVNTKNMQWDAADAALIKTLESDSGDKTPEMKEAEAKRIAASARQKAIAFMNAGDPQMAAFWNQKADYYEGWKSSGQGYKAQANKLKVEEYMPEQIRNMKSQVQKRADDTRLTAARDSSRIENWNASRSQKERQFNKTFGLRVDQFNALNRFREHAMSLADKRFDFDSSMKNKQLNLNYLKAIQSGMDKTVTNYTSVIKEQSRMYHDIEKMSALDFLLPDERSKMLSNAQAEIDRRVAGGEKLQKGALDMIVAQSPEYQEAKLRKNNRLQEELDELDKLKQDQSDAEQARKISGILAEDFRTRVEGNVKADVKSSGNRPKSIAGDVPTGWNPNLSPEELRKLMEEAASRARADGADRNPFSGAKSSVGGKKGKKK